MIILSGGCLRQLNTLQCCCLSAADGSDGMAAASAPRKGSKWSFPRTGNRGRHNIYCCLCFLGLCFWAQFNTIGFLGWKLVGWWHDRIRWGMPAPYCPVIFPSQGFFQELHWRFSVRVVSAGDMQISHVQLCWFNHWPQDSLYNLLSNWFPPLFTAKYRV